MAIVKLDKKNFLQEILDSKGNDATYASKIRNLLIANKMFSDVYQVNLSFKQVGECIIIPWHTHREEFELVPKKGLLLMGAAKNYLQVNNCPDYQKRAPNCFEAFKTAFRQIENNDFLGDIILTLRPIDYDYYNQLEQPQGKFSHVDGLHRLIAIYLTGRVDLANYVVFSDSIEEIKLIVH